MKCLALAAMIAALSFGAASAATFQYSFDLTSNGGVNYVGGGQFEGDLQADGDTILNMDNMTLDYTVASVQYSLSGTPTSAIGLGTGSWSLSGLVTDWMLANGTIGTGVSFNDFQNGWAIFDRPMIEITPVDFTSDDFSVAMAPVPLPASLPLLAFGMAALGLMARRKTA